MFVEEEKECDFLCFSKLVVWLWENCPLYCASVYCIVFPMLKAWWILIWGSVYRTIDCRVSVASCNWIFKRNNNHVICVSSSVLFWGSLFIFMCDINPFMANSNLSWVYEAEEWQQWIHFVIAREPSCKLQLKGCGFWKFRMSGSSCLKICDAYVI